MHEVHEYNSLQIRLTSQLIEVSLQKIPLFHHASLKFLSKQGVLILCPTIFLFYVINLFPS